MPLLRYVPSSRSVSVSQLAVSEQHNVLLLTAQIPSTMRIATSYLVLRPATNWPASSVTRLP